MQLKYSNLIITSLLIVCTVNLLYRIKSSKIVLKNFTYSVYDAKQNPPYSKVVFIRKIGTNEPVFGYAAEMDKEFLLNYIFFRTKGIELINASILTGQNSIYSNEFNLLNTAQSWLNNDYYRFSISQTKEIPIGASKPYENLYKHFYSANLFQIDNVKRYLRYRNIEGVITNDTSVARHFKHKMSSIVTLPQELNRYSFGHSSNVYRYIRLNGR